MTTTSRYHFLLFLKIKASTAEFAEPDKDIIRGSPSLTPCALWRARQATNSNRLQSGGARDLSQYERASRQSALRLPT
jgi:hypothetical protein